MSQSNRGRYGLGYPERGRWKGNNQSGAWSTWKKMPNDRVPLEPEDLPKGHVLAELELNKLEAEVEQHGTVKYTKEGYELLASFNWFPNDGKPAIIVPGLAARWTPPPLPAWLTPDAGLYYVDQNAYFWPTSPLEPALRAIFTLNPTFDPNPIDLVIDRNALRKLFRFASGDKKLIHDFKFYTEVINNTVLTTRWEKQAAKVIAEDEFRGFGHSFEKEFTKYTKGLEGSTSHNRMAKYRFGGLNLIVRFSADAFLGSKDMSSGESTSSLEKGSDSAQAQANKAKDLPWRRRRAGSNSTPAAGNKTRTTAGVAGPAYIQRHDRPQASDTTAQDPIEEDLIDLSDVFDKSLKIGPEKKPPAAGNTTRTTASVAGPAYIQRYDRPQASDTTAQDPTEDLIDLSDVFDKSLKIEPEKEFEKPPAPLEIIPGGILMPQERVLEIKTRADNRIIDLTDQIPQLWFSDTSNLYIGYHHRGSFMRVDTEAMNAKALEVWEDQNQDNLKKMSQLLRKITQVVRSIEGGRAQVACVGGKLKIFALEEGETAIGTLPVDLRGKWNVK